MRHMVIAVAALLLVFITASGDSPGTWHWSTRMIVLLSVGAAAPLAAWHTRKFLAAVAVVMAIIVLISWGLPWEWSRDGRIAFVAAAFQFGAVGVLARQISDELQKDDL